MEPARSQGAQGAASPRRWWLGMVALGVVAWSGWIRFVQQPDDEVVPVVRRDRTTTGPMSSATPSRGAASAAEDVCTTAQVPLRRALLEVPPRSPFGALPPPVIPPSKLAVVAPPPPPPTPVVVAPPPPAPPPRPVLPYRFLGMLADRDGSQPQVFLLMGEKILLARPGESLEGGFKLEGIGPRELRFVWPADNTILTLGIDGVSS